MIKHLIRLNYGRYKPVGGLFKNACYHPYIDGWTPCGIGSVADLSKYGIRETSCGKRLCGNCRDVMRKPVVKCGKCKYWVSEEEDIGECRINPPTYDGSQVNYTAVWPSTSPLDCCMKGVAGGLKLGGVKTQKETQAETRGTMVDVPVKPGFLASKLPVKGVVS